MKALSTTTSNTLWQRNGRLYTWIRGVTVALIILIVIETFNQFLILSGSWVGQTVLQDMPHTRVGIGIFQQGMQAAAGILLFWWLFRRGVGEMGVNVRLWQRSLTLFVYFALAWLLVIALNVAVVAFYFPDTWAVMRAINLPPLADMVATLLFQSFFPGFGEEILFRGLILQVLTTWVFPGYAENRVGKVGVVLLSAFYFAAAHIYFTLSPFQITHLDIVQLAMALGCGMVYAIFYLQTRSLLAPFLAHNFANVTSTVCGYLISGL